MDITAYGSDLPGAPTFAQMIKRVITLVPELKRLRLSSIDISEVDNELFHLMAYMPQIMQLEALILNWLIHCLQKQHLDSKR